MAVVELQRRIRLPAACPLRAERCRRCVRPRERATSSMALGAASPFASRPARRSNTSCGGTPSGRPRCWRAGSGNVVDLADLDGGHVAIFGEPRRHEHERPPSVGANSRDGHFRPIAAPDQVHRSSTRRCYRNRSGRRHVAPGSRAARRCRPTSRSLAISSSLSDESSLNFWIPMFFSMNQGGIAPRAAQGRFAS